MNEQRIHFMKLRNEENELKGQKKYMKKNGWPYTQKRLAGILWLYRLCSSWEKWHLCIMNLPVHKMMYPTIYLLLLNDVCAIWYMGLSRVTYLNTICFKNLTPWQLTWLRNVNFTVCKVLRISTMTFATNSPKCRTQGFLAYENCTKLEFQTIHINWMQCKLYLMLLSFL